MKNWLALVISACTLTACAKTEIPTTSKYIKFFETNSGSVVTMAEYATRDKDTYRRYRCVDGEAVRFIIQASNKSVLDVTSIGTKCIDLDMNNDDDIAKMANIPKDMKPIAESLTEDTPKEEPAASQPQVRAETVDV